jgi:hypothetical protein
MRGVSSVIVIWACCVDGVVVEGGVIVGFETSGGGVSGGCGCVGAGAMLLLSYVG